MRDPFQNTRRRRRGVRLIEVDAWINSTVYEVGRFVTGTAESFSIFMRRFRVTGFRRGFFEVLGDAVTIGTGGLLLLLALALPAFEATRTDWRTQGDYSLTILDRYGNEIGKRGIRHSDAVPLEEMPDYLIKAVLATEDRRFFTHFGIDVLGTIRAMMENLRANSVVQGGSSLSQQLAKNLFLSNERTLERKVKEAFLALWLEANLTKTEILKLYLDRAYMGGGNFGVEAASEFYFGKSVKDVNLAESALLAGLFKAPARYAPHINLPAARARANEVLSNMVQAGFLTEGQVIGARRHPADVIEQQAGAGSPDYFLDWVFDQVKELDPPGDRVLTVRSTLDAAMQRVAEDAVESTLREFGESYRVKQAALVALDPDGAVREHGRRARLRRKPVQPRDRGAPPAGIVVQAVRLCDGDDERLHAEERRSRRADLHRQLVPAQLFGGGYSGPVTLTTGLVKSINTIPVRLAQAIGRDKIVETAHKMGHDDRAPHHPLAAPRRIRGQGRRHGRRLCRLRQWRLQGDALRLHADHQQPGRRRLRPQARRAAAGAVLDDQVVADMNGMLSRSRNGAPAGARSSTGSARPARPARHPPIATHGSSASPATIAPPYGSAMTATPPTGA